MVRPWSFRAARPSPWCWSSLACRSEDPRLPQQLYDEAIQLNQQGRQLEARTLMEQLAAKYPDTPTGQQASKDLYLMDALLRQDLQERQRQLRSIMKRTADALTRYKGKHGEYPRFLSSPGAGLPGAGARDPLEAPVLLPPLRGHPDPEHQGPQGPAGPGAEHQAGQLLPGLPGGDLQPGGEDLAADTFIVDGEFYKEKTLPPIPQPQPVR